MKTSGSSFKKTGKHFKKKAGAHPAHLQLREPDLADHPLCHTSLRRAADYSEVIVHWGHDAAALRPQQLCTGG